MKAYSILGDFYHKHDFVYPSVQKAADLAGVTLVDCPVTEIEKAIDANPEIIIMACENRVNPEDEKIDLWLTDEIDEKITSYVKNGGSFIAIHAALASYPTDSKYIDMVKGYFVDHPPEHYNVRYTSKEQLPSSKDPAPVDYTVLDEHYVLNVDTANTNVFLTLSSDYGEGNAGWYHNYGKGKVIAVAPTHNKAGFEHPETIRLYKEAILWAKEASI